MYLDRFETKPIEAHRNPDGEIQFKDTGDDMVDRWEAQIANGEIPDLMEAFDDESIKYISKLKQAAQARNPYEGLSLKSTFDKISESAARQGLTVGNQAQKSSHDLRKELAEKLAGPTFGFDPDEID